MPVLRTTRNTNICVGILGSMLASLACLKAVIVLVSSLAQMGVRHYRAAASTQVPRTHLTEPENT